ncbi:MAG: glycerate kinase [Syntrophomonadaceae bacterium]|nr:glycerate kinase [Syntrophomonadaceae bacterium]
MAKKDSIHFPIVIVAPDSFKESLTAAQAARSIAGGIYKVFPGAKVIEIPLSDGGEGLLDCLIGGTEGRLIQHQVTGPLGNKVAAKFGILGDGRTGVIEMAEASGLTLVPRQQRNPMRATSFGTGELIRAALDQGCRRLIVGIGGSATNDGGAGMAQALGVGLFDQAGQKITWGAEGLLKLDSIDMASLDPRIFETEILVASDVTNPLVGPTGAAYIYGPQKGADEAMVPVLDQALQKLAAVIYRDLNIEVAQEKGAGAAGGMGAGLMAFAGGKLRSGLELVLDMLAFEERVAEGVDLIITGEGQINGQSLYGKVPVGVARLAKKYDVPVFAMVGSIGSEADKIYEAGIDSVMTIVPGPIPLAQAMDRASEFLEDATVRAMRLINLLS